MKQPTPVRILDRFEHIQYSLEYCYIPRSHTQSLEEMLLEESFQLVALHPKTLTVPLLLMKQKRGSGVSQMLALGLAERCIQELAGIEVEELSGKELIKLEEERGKQVN